jgi:hypothetical protein
MVKLSHLPETRMGNGDLQRWPTVCSLSLRILVVTSILAVLMGTATRLGAQSVTSGDIVGLVTDPSGAVLPNANVSLKNQENGSAQNTVDKLSRCVSVLAATAWALHGVRR